ncbi:TPA: KilA-N domain-containing protein [Mannheimia haemolytica]
MSNLTILNTTISQHDNLFNLKDLHRISGNEKKHEPYLFIRLDTTQALVSAIQAEGTATPIKTLRGTQGGTYACKEIVIAYAAWISPQFHLVVLRAFLNQLENLQKNTEIRPLAEPNKRTPLVIIRKDSQELKLFLRLLSHAHEYGKIQDAIRNGTNDPNLLPICQHILYQHNNGDGFMFSFKANIQNDLKQASDLIAHIV